MNIGLVLDAGSVTAVRGNPEAQTLEQVVSMPFPDNLLGTLEDKARFAAEVVKTLVPNPADHDIWFSLPEPDVYVLRLPVLKGKGEELDAVALLNASRLTNFNPAETLFDYRVSQVMEKDGMPTQLAGAVSAPQNVVDAWKNAFAANGIELTGITSAGLAAPLLSLKHPEANAWQSYALLSMSLDESVVSIIEKGGLVLQRTFNFGLSNLLNDVIGMLPNAYETVEGETDDARRTRLMQAVKAALSDDAPDPILRESIIAAIDPSIDRAVKYLERTFNYYERVEHGEPLQGLYFVTDDCLEKVLTSAIEERTGLACVRRTVRSFVPTANEAEFIRLRTAFKSVVLYEAGALVLADDNVPNLLDLPKDRRQRERNRRIVMAASGVLVACSVVALGFGVWFGTSWVAAGDEFEAKSAAVAAIKEPLSKAVVTDEMSRLVKLETDAAALLERRRFAGVLTVLSQVRNDDVYVRSVEMVPAENVKTTNNRRRNEPPGMEKKKGTGHMLVVHVSVYGTPQERETALAEFLSRFEKRHLGGPITVLEEKTADGGAGYAVRLSGS